MLYQSAFSSRYKYNLLTTFAVFFFLILSPASGLCRTPIDLANIIQNFNHGNSPEEQLDLSYSGLDLYAPIANKSSVDPADRKSLSKMKRLVLTNAIAKAGGNVLIAGIGSTGNWVAKRPGKVVNDYPAGNQDVIVQLKLKGCYMEGLSDLDFVIMGQGARAYQNKIYHIFAEGRGDTHLTPEEMDELEINFITDAQIKSLASGSKGRNFWNQLMDLSNSSAHAEKYITKGGKALYGMDHLYENGVVITLEKHNSAMVFADYASKNGHKMGPFTLPHLFGGACDMDYFIAHALNKAEQERVKSVLQVIKYLKRDEWMLKRAAKNIARLPKELSQRPGTVKILNNYAADIARFTDNAIKQKVWASPQATVQFGQQALDLSGLVCSAAHEMLIEIGNNLLSLRSLNRLTPTTSAILTSLVYDLSTVEDKRYQGKYPKWYASEYNLTADNPRAETLYFLKRYQEGKKKDDGSAPVISRAEQKINEEMELGPMLPPPVATIEITETSVSPKKPTAGAPVTITISGKLNNVAKELPDFSQNQYSDKEKEYMEELGDWSLRASFYRMKIRYLMKQDASNNDPKSTSEKIYVSPYEVEALAESLEVAEDEVAYLSEQMNREVNTERTGDYGVLVRPTPSTQSIDDYLDAMEKTSNQAIKYIESSRTHAKSFLGFFESYKDSDGQENLNRLNAIEASAGKSIDAINGSLGLISEVLKKRKQLQKLADKDPGAAAELMLEIEGGLEKISKSTALSLVKAHRINADLGIAAAKTHKLLAGFVDNTRGQVAITGLKKSMTSWEAQQKTVSQTTIPALEQKALWLKRGAWAAKGASWGFEAYAGYQDYQKNKKALEKTDLGGGAEDAVLALTVAGKAMEKVIGIIPIPVLKDSLNGYAKILSDSAKWAIAVDAAQSRIYQDLGFDIRSHFPPKAYKSILEKYSSDARPGTFFNRMRMPLSEYNGLTIMATPDQDMKWLVWSKHLANGYTLLDKETHRKVSLYSAWYRRTQGKNISGNELHSLLTKGKTDNGEWFNDDVSKDKIKRNAETLLELEAFSAYLKSLTKRKSFTGEELWTYKAMLYRAARQFAQYGFLLTNADIAETLAAVLYDAPIEGNWQTAYNILTMTRGNADKFNQDAKDWDKVTGGEKYRLEKVLKKQIQAKVDRRTKAREKHWKDAKLGGDDNKPIAAGLLVSQVGLVFNHALFSKAEAIYADDFIDITGDTFTLSWKTTIPDGVDLTRATYLGVAEIAGYPGSRIQIATPMATSENKILEEMIALAEEAEELGNPTWNSCQHAIAGFTPFEEQKDEITRLISELKAHSQTLNALNFKVEAVPEKLSHNLVESERRAAAIEGYAEQIKQLQEKICEHSNAASSAERGQQISLMAQIHSPLAQLRKKKQLHTNLFEKAQEELTIWEQFDAALTEVDRLLTESNSWAPTLVDNFTAAANQLALAEKNKQALDGIKSKADQLLRQGSEVYSQPESAATLDEIKIAHGRVLRPQSEVSDCIEIAKQKKNAAGSLGGVLTNTLARAEELRTKATNTKKKIGSEENRIETLAEQISAVDKATRQLVLQAETAMSEAQICIDTSTQPKTLIPVPDLTGKTITQARKKLAEIGLLAKFNGGNSAPSKAQAYQVASQSPEAGKPILPGESVFVVVYGGYLGTGIPDLKGLSVKEAKKRIATAGFTASLAGGSSAPSKKLEFKVQKQWPEAGEAAAQGAAIKITVYGAVQYKSVPSIVGMTAAQAKSTLSSAGLQHSLYGGDAAPKKSMSYKVQSQSPDAGTQVIKGSAVNAHIYGNFSKQAALAEHTCENFPGTTIQWDDEKGTAWCICPSGQVWSKESSRCIADPKIAERKKNQRKFWGAVVDIAIPIIVNEITSGGNTSSGGETGSSGGSNNNSNTNTHSSGGSSGSHTSTGNTQSSGGDPKQCELKYCPSCADAGMDFLEVAINSQCTDCRERKKAQIASCIRGEKSGQGTKYAPPDYIVICKLEWNSETQTKECGRHGYKIVRKSAPIPSNWKKAPGPSGPDTWTNLKDQYPNAF